MKIRAIVWDIGGVLVDNPNVRNFWQNKRGSKELRKEFGSGRISIGEFVNKGSKFLNLSKKEFLRRYKKAYFSIKFIKEGFKLYKENKIDNYILSDTNPLHANFLRENFPEIFEIAKMVFLSNEIGLRKDDPEIFKYLIGELKLLPSQILFIDDKSEYLESAKKFGIITLLCDDPKELKKKIKNFLNGGE